MSASYLSLQGGSNKEGPLKSHSHTKKPLDWSTHKAYIIMTSSPHSILPHNPRPSLQGHPPFEIPSSPSSSSEVSLSPINTAPPTMVTDCPDWLESLGRISPSRTEGEEERLEVWLSKGGGSNFCEDKERRWSGWRQDVGGDQM